MAHVSGCPIFHCNRYHAESQCEHCAGVIRDAEWCITSNKRGRYTYEVAVKPCNLDYADRLILRALGEEWTSY